MKHYLTAVIFLANVFAAPPPANPVFSPTIAAPPPGNPDFFATPPPANPVFLPTIAAPPPGNPDFLPTENSPPPAKPARLKKFTIYTTMSQIKTDIMEMEKSFNDCEDGIETRIWKAAKGSCSFGIRMLIKSWFKKVRVSSLSVEDRQLGNQWADELKTGQNKERNWVKLVVGEIEAKLATAVFDAPPPANPVFLPTIAAPPPGNPDFLPTVNAPPPAKPARLKKFTIYTTMSQIKTDIMEMEKSFNDCEDGIETRIWKAAKGSCSFGIQMLIKSWFKKVRVSSLSVEDRQLGNQWVNELENGQNKERNWVKLVVGEIKAKIKER